MARSMNGSTDTIVYSGSISLTAPLTLACWFLPSASNIALMAAVNVGAGNTARNGWSLETSSSSKLQAITGNGTTTSIATTTPAYNAGVWNHAAGVFSASNNRIAYLNGVATAPDTGNVTPAALTDYYLGGTSLTGSIVRKFNGSLAEVAIWSAALSANEITALASGRSPRHIQPNSLKAYWPLFGLQSPEPDLSGNAQNGTLTGTGQANHAPVTMFTPRRPTFFSSAVVATVVSRRPFSLRVGSRCPYLTRGAL